MPTNIDHKFMVWAIVVLVALLVILDFGYLSTNPISFSGYGFTRMRDDEIHFPLDCYRYFVSFLTYNFIHNLFPQ